MPYTGWPPSLDPTRAPPSRAPATPAPPGTYTVVTSAEVVQGVFSIRNAFAGKEVDVKGGDVVINTTRSGNLTQAWTFRVVSSPHYAVVNAYTDGAMGVSGASADDGASVVQYSYSANASQLWSVYTNGTHFAMINKNSGKAVDLWGNNATDTAPIKQATWVAGSTSQTYLLARVPATLANGYYRIAIVHALGLTLPYVGVPSTAAGAAVQSSTCADCSLWEFTAVGSHYKIVGAFSSLALSVVNASTGNAAALYQAAYTGADSQLWSVYYQNETTVGLVNKNSGKALTLLNGNTNIGTRMVQYTYFQNSTQLFVLQSYTPAGAASNGTVAEGSYVIRSRYSGLVLTPLSTAANASVVHSPSTSGSVDQVWQVRNLSNGYFSIANANSGFQLAFDADSTATSASLTQASATTGIGRQWALRAVVSGGVTYFGLVNRYAGNAANATNTSAGAGRRVVSAAWSGSSPQLWTFEEPPSTPAPTPMPATKTPVSHAPVSNDTVTRAPVTKAPRTKAPVTKAPRTKAPVTKAPVTKAPVTKAPKTKAPVTKAPRTKAPVTKAPKTKAPVTKAPRTKAPVTKAPVTKAPRTKAPVTKAPVTKAPRSKAPRTQAPATWAPPTKSPTAPILLEDVVMYDCCFFKIRSKDSGLLLAVSFSSSVEDAAVVQYNNTYDCACHVWGLYRIYSPASDERVYRIYNGYSSLSLAFLNDSTSESVSLTQASGADTSARQWLLVGVTGDDGKVYFGIVNALSGNAATATNTPGAQGLQVVSSTWSRMSTQLWHIEESPPPPTTAPQTEAPPTGIE